MENLASEPCLEKKKEADTPTHICQDSYEYLVLPSQYAVTEKGTCRVCPRWHDSWIYSDIKQKLGSIPLWLINASRVGRKKKTPGTFSTHLKKHTICTEATEVFIWSLISSTSEWSAWVRSSVTQSLERWQNLQTASGGGFIAVCLLIWNLLHLLGWDCTCKQPKWTICSSWQLPHIWNEVGGDPDVDAEQKKTQQDYTQIYDLYKQTSMHLMWLHDTPMSVNKVNVNRACFDRFNPKQSWTCGFATRRLVTA